MKKVVTVYSVVFSLGMATSFDANAWFFIFIPSSITRAVGDAISGSKGNICVKESTKAGDILSSPNGNTAKVLSTSGTSSICQNPALPIRAELEFTYSFASKAGVEIPDDYEPVQLTDLERFNGYLLKAKSKSLKNKGVTISTTTRKPTTNILQMANNIAAKQVGGMKDAVAQNPEQTTIHGMNAVRFEVKGTLKGLFGQSETYLTTIFEGKEEVMVVSAYVPSDNYLAVKPELIKITENISGMDGSVSDTPSKATVESINVNPQLPLTISTPMPSGQPSISQ